MSSDSSVKVEYTDHFVAFIDVLGFSDLVNSSVNIPKSKTLVNTFYKRAHTAFKAFEELEIKSPIYTLAISDTIILAVPVQAINDSKIDTLRELCTAVGRIQYDMARHHLWLRGGITGGPCWIDKKRNLIVGPAFIRAHHLEKNVAKYPRVILDMDLIMQTQLNNKVNFISKLNELDPDGLHANWKTDCIFDWNRTVLRYSGPLVEDYPLFVDYLSPSKLEDQDDSLQSIIDNLGQDIYKGNHHEKTRWTIQYLLAHLNSTISPEENPNNYLMYMKQLREF